MSFVHRAIHYELPVRAAAGVMVSLLVVIDKLVQHMKKT